MREELDIRTKSKWVKSIEHMVINSKIKQKEEGANVIVQCYSVVTLSHAGLETEEHDNVD